MRNELAKSLYQQAKKNKNIFVIVADISPAGKMQDFQKEFPDRFINTGVAEQVMIGLSAGLAIKKKIPFVYTIATFALYRPFEMIRVDLCYQNLPVCVVGMGGGTIYSNLGPTHLTQEDISIARSIPNLQVLAPCDPYELKNCINYLVQKSKHPTYLRIGKTGEKNFLLNNSEKWYFGKIRKLVSGKKICFISFGPIINKAFEIKENLNKIKIFPSIYSCHTLKPFDKLGIKKIFKKYKKIVIIEDHSEIGGLAEIIKLSALENKYYGQIFSFSLKDEFIKCYSSQDDLLTLHGINNKKIIKKIL
jgi:transketolase